MRDNITKVVERQERLDSLQDKTGRCFSYNFTHTSVAAPIWPTVRDVDAYASHRQSCRFRSRLQTQCESGPEGMFDLILCHIILELNKFIEHVVSFECESCVSDA
jgi:hypothetical protein